VRLSPSSLHGAGGGISVSSDLQPTVGSQRAVMWGPANLLIKDVVLGLFSCQDGVLSDA
jgi:hypothetical protein